MKKSWLKEIARDLLALGSIPFYFLVVIRAIIGRDYAFLYEMIIAAAIIFILNFIIIDANMYIARSFVVLVFTSLFYKETVFTVFAAVIWILLLISAFYSKRKFGSIIRGVLIGAISCIIGYYGAHLLLK